MFGIRKKNLSFSENQTIDTAVRLNQILNGYSELSDILTANQDIKNAAAWTWHGSNEKYIKDTYTLQKELKLLCSLYGNELNMIAVYFPKSNSAVTMARRVEPDHINQLLSSLPASFIQNIETPELVPTWQTFFSKDLSTSNWMMRKMTGSENSTAYIILQFNFRSLLKEITPEESAVYIGDDKTCMGAYHLQEGSPEYSEVISLKGQGTLNHFYISRLENRLDPLFVTVCTSQIALVRMNALFFTMVISIIIILLGCVVLLYFVLSSKVLSPISKVIDASEYTKPSADLSDLLYSIADDLIVNIDSNQQLKRKNNDILPFAQGRILTRLLEEENQKEISSLADYFMEINDIQPDQEYALFAISCSTDDFNKLQATTQATAHPENKFYYFTANMVHNLLPDGNSTLIVPINKNLLVVICFSNQSDLADTMRLSQTSIISYFSGALSVQLNTTELKTGHGKDSFIDSLQQIYKSISYRSFWDEDESAVPQQDVYSFSEYCQLVRKMVNRLNTQDYDSALEMLDLILQNALGVNENDIKLSKYRFYAIAAVTINTIDEQLGDFVDEKEIIEFEKKLYNIDSVRDFKKNLNAMIVRLVKPDIQKNNKDSTINNHIEEIKNYILEHYTNYELNVAHIAAHFQLSLSHLSRIFKESTGINILDYIQKQRVIKAKELLPDYQIKDVAHMVGFWDAQALVRSFKKHEGISPGEYKKLMSNKK